ncbi:hypothetical protein VHEMI04182 [[Torrubiella] hemipterigena]|uniref:Cytochrome P450 n=1 Tax=[Torrubiella] hemipterigena TaxID=1531966 RepID=A0A0A1TD49_9HYPO|nr:hypothetical protein VHEMI04182 [[Torrubiella] hemipterigena]
MGALSRLAWVAGLTVASVFVCKRLLSRWRRHGMPLPPSPPGEFILGHLRVIPTFNPENAYMAWSKKLKSDILSVNFLGQTAIILNSARSATELLDRRGANYGNRPHFVLFEIMGWTKALTFLQWGPEFRLHRKVLQKSFQNSNIIKYRPLQEREAQIMLQGLLDDPDSWETITRRFATAIVLSIAFGIRIEKQDDIFIQVAADASYALTNGGAPGATPVDFFPFLRFLPRFFHDSSLRVANDWRWAIDNLHNKPYDAALALPVKNESLVNSLLDQRQSEIDNGQVPELGLDDIKGAAGAVFAAGQDTTWATLTAFLINMLLHPAVQCKAQAQLDEVVGRDRLPDFSDRPKMPYLEYVVQEVFRWCPVSPIGVPHKSLKDDIYEGYFIPAGSLVFANARAMTHDESLYQNPDEYEPERYIPEAEGGRGEPLPKGHFGFGRRICIGRHLAEASVWIFVARVLSTMNLKKAVDENGEEITPTVNLTSGLTSHPKDFPCRFEPRDERSIEIIRGMSV